MPTNMPAAPGGKKAAAFGLIGLLVGLVGGYGAGRVSTGTPVNPLSAIRGGNYQEGYNAAKKKIADAHLFAPAPTEAMELTGTVMSVGSDSLRVSVDLATANPLEEIDAPKERTVTVTSATKIMKMVPKTPEEFQKDFEAFQKAAANGGAPGTPPNNLKKVAIALQDLKAGDSITVAADHDILKEAAFTATEIDLNATTATSPSAATNPNGAPTGSTPGPTGQRPSTTTQGPTGAPPPSNP